MKKNKNKIALSLLFLVFFTFLSQKTLRANNGSTAKAATWQRCISELVIGTLSDTEFSDLKVTSVSMSWLAWLTNLTDGYATYTYAATDDTYDFSGSIRAIVNEYEITNPRSGEVLEKGWKCEKNNAAYGTYFELINQSKKVIYSQVKVEKIKPYLEEEEEEKPESRGLLIDLEIEKEVEIVEKDQK